METPISSDVANRLTFTPVITFALIGLNVLVYIAMGLSGVSWAEPSITDAIRWGADFGPFTIGGEWWRLFTSMFVHFGIIHIGFNMWCLWSLGISLEQLMGRKAFAFTYFASGLAASVVSVAWSPWRASAGASGAIFGLAGEFVSYLLLRKTSIERSAVKQQLKSLAIFILYNLLRGAASVGIDNSAHLGGLAAGLILGALIPPLVRHDAANNPQVAPQIETTLRGKTNQEAFPLPIAVSAGLVLFAAAMWTYSKNAPAVHYGKAVKAVSRGNLALGITEMQNAVASDKKSIFANALLGEWQLEQADPAAAIPALEHALSLIPGAYDVEHNLALAYLGSGRALDAINEISIALLQEKNDAWRGQYILALAAENMGAVQLASQNLQSVVKSNPDFQDARDTLARLQSGSKPESTVTIPYSKLAMKSEAWPLYP